MHISQHFLRKTHKVQRDLLRTSSEVTDISEHTRKKINYIVTCLFHFDSAARLFLIN